MNPPESQATWVSASKVKLAPKAFRASLRLGEKQAVERVMVNVKTGIVAVIHVDPSLGTKRHTYTISPIISN